MWDSKTNFKITLQGRILKAINITVQVKTPYAPVWQTRASLCPLSLGLSHYVIVSHKTSLENFVVVMVDK